MIEKAWGTDLLSSCKAKEKHFSSLGPAVQKAPGCQKTVQMLRLSNCAAHFLFVHNTFFGQNQRVETICIPWKPLRVTQGGN